MTAEGGEGGRLVDEERRVLLVEDNPGDVDLVREHLADVPGSVPSIRVAGTLARALEAVEEGGLDVVLLDLNLPDAGGLETLDRMLARAEGVPVVVLTGGGDQEVGLDAVRRGAADFLPKDELTGPLLLRSIHYAVERARRHRSETRFRALIENSRDLVAVLRPDFTVRYVTPSIRRILGFEPEEKIGEDATLEVHPEDRERAEREGRKVLEDPDYVSHIQYRVRHADGGWRALDTVAQNRLDDPAIEGLVLNSWDITDLRRTQRELEESREWLEVLQWVSATANEMEVLTDALQALVAELPPRLGWDVAHAFLVEEGRLRSLPAWHPSDDDRFAAFREATVGMDFGGGETLVSEAASTGRVQHLTGLPGSRWFQRRDAAGDLWRGLAIPVLAGEEVVAVLELFSALQKPVDERLVELAREVGVQFGRVAERERSLARIRESRKLLRQLVEGVPDAMYLKDREGRYLLINEAGAELVGQTPDEVIGSTDRELFEPESAQEVMSQDRRVLEEGETSHHEEEITDLHGRTRTYLVTKGPLRDPEGRVSGLFGISRDITELKRTQANLQERVKELRTLYCATQELARTDRPLERRLETVVHLVPPGWLHPEVTEGRITWKDFEARTPGFRETPWTLSTGIEAGGRTVGRFEVVLTEERPPEDVGPFLDEEAELLDGLALAVGDAIDRQGLEEEFVRAQKMEAVGRLSGGVAHDFNNLLTVIRAHTDFLLMESEESDPVREEARSIQEAAERAAELTRHLLAFSREQVLRPRVVDPNDVVRTLERLAVRALGEDISVETELQDDLPAIEIDPGQLEQALLNLAVNARDAMPGGGTLRLATGFQEVGEEEAGDRPDLEEGPYVRLTVSDTGVGMNEETRTRIFEPFYSTKSRDQGTGLGLSMVYGIVAQSGGAIDVTSTPDRGTTFVLRFPAVDGEPGSVEDHASSEPSGRAVEGRMLVVEDDESVRRVTRVILERAGLDVVAVEDVEAGLAALEKEPDGFDLVLTDLVLPGRNGTELIREVMERMPHLPLIAMSGYAEGSPGRRADLPAEVRFVQKPFSPARLVSEVHEVLAEGNA